MGLLEKVFAGTFCNIYLLVLLFTTRIYAKPLEGSPSHAEIIKSYMNFSVAPCDDFYEYACGNYRNMKPDRRSLGDRKNIKDIQYTLGDITAQLVGRMDLAEALNVSTELKRSQGSFNFCLSRYDTVNFLFGNDSAYPKVIRSIGGFPAVDGDTWNASNFNWFKMSAHLFNVTRYRERGLISDWNAKFERKSVLKLGFDTIVNVENIANKSTEAYQLNEKRMLGYLRSLNLPEDRIAEVIDGIFAFWREALAISEVNDNDDNCANFDITSYWEIVIGLHLKESICDSYLVEMDKVCSRHSQAVANYLTMHLLYTYDDELKDSKYKIDECTTLIQLLDPILFDKLYMAEHFTDEKRLYVSEIAKEVRKSFRRSIEENDWLDSETREEILLKESGIRSKIGFVELPDDNKRLVVQLEPRAFYSVNENSINIMAGILYPPVYHRSWPLALKFGTLGFIVGHELTHSFDRNVSLRFEERTRCFVDQYNKFLVSEVDRHVDGQNTLDENIADNGGLRQAFAAYRRHKELIPKDSKQDRSSEQMPGIDLLPEQLFFLGFAQLSCADYKKDVLMNQLDDVHTIAKYRVLGALSNNEDFFEVFNCPVGSGMRPNKTCRLW